MGLNSKDPMADDPPYSRLFVIYNRKEPVSETRIKHDFSPFGNIEDIFLVKDKKTGDHKGVAYVKFSKMSEAALAMEKLNNKQIKGHSSSYKIYIAKSRGEKGPDRDDPLRYLRLFVTVPKTATEDDIKQHFLKFGEISTVKLLRNRETNESKGLAYVTYTRIYDAAKAVEEEESESGYKAVIARPKEKPLVEPTTSHKTDYRTVINDSITADSFNAMVSSKLNKDQIFRLFDIAPGLRNIQIVSQNILRTEIVATYNSTLAAEYALNKLQKVEYPLGEYISIESKMIDSSNSMIPEMRKRDFRGNHLNNFNNETSVDHEVNQKLSALTKVLSDATALLKSAGVSTDGLGTSLGSVSGSLSPPMSKMSGLRSGILSSLNYQNDDDEKWSPYCNFPVPLPQKTLPRSLFSEATGMRLFMVGHPCAPSLEALYDVYCRFGNFAGATILPKKNYGYLYFCSVESALKAIECTDDKLIDGSTVKIVKADPKGESSNKRKKLDH